MIDTSFFTFLSANIGAGWTAQEGKLDWDRVLPWVWYRRASTIQERLLSGVPLNAFTTEFDVEIVGPDIDAVQSQADNIKTLLQTISPCSLLGSTFCLSIEVMEHSDDYIAKTIFDTDTGLHLATFQVKIIHRA